VVRLFLSDHQPAELPDFQGSTAAAVANPSPPPAAIGGVDEEFALDEANPEPPPGDENQPAAAVIAPKSQGARVASKEYSGVAVPIENTAALASFFDSLGRSARGEPGAITRVAHYGDSSVAADEITHTARRKLQLRFGDAGHGFMLTAKSNMFYGHRDVMHRESSGWDLSSIVRRQLRSGYYGYGGIVANGRAGEYATFGSSESGQIGRAVSRFEVFYQRFTNGGELQISVDNKDERSIATHVPGASEDAWELVKVPDGSHQMTLRARGDVRVYGVSQERDVPGVVYDALGLVGARAERLLGADPQHIARQIAHRSPSLLVLGFGGNESGNDSLDMRRYAATLTQVIKLMRAGKPDMACLLFGPLDQGERNGRGDVVTLRSLPGIVDAQRQVAKEQGCGFWDTFKAMGGEGSVGRWYHARPRLFSPDFRHATPNGYSIIGNMYYQALLKAFADHQAKH
jgi:lysophospholipase L1-like esterase